MEVGLELIVRSTEIDANGHVNNAKYLEYLEWGREEWYDQHGLSYDTLLELGVQTVTVRIQIDYLLECRQNDRLIVLTKPLKTGNSSYVFTQRIVNQNGDETARADVTLVCINKETRKSTPLPPELRLQFAGHANRSN